VNERTHELYGANVEKIEMAYVRAVGVGVAGPVVLVLDLRDEFAAAIAAGLEARGAGFVRAPDLAVFAVAGGGSFGAVIADVTTAEHLDEFCRLGPAGTFPCLVFAGGGIEGFYRPIPE
jgi:hypothetical protein